MNDGTELFGTTSCVWFSGNTGTKAETSQSWNWKVEVALLVEVELATEELLPLYELLSPYGDKPCAAAQAAAIAEARDPGRATILHLDP